MRFLSVNGTMIKLNCHVKCELDQINLKEYIDSKKEEEKNEDEIDQH